MCCRCRARRRSHPFHYTWLHRNTQMWKNCCLPTPSIKPDFLRDHIPVRFTDKTTAGTVSGMISVGFPVTFHFPVDFPAEPERNIGNLHLDLRAAILRVLPGQHRKAVASRGTDIIHYTRMHPNIYRENPAAVPVPAPYAILFIPAFPGIYKTRLKIRKLPRNGQGRIIGIIHTAYPSGFIIPSRWKTPRRDTSTGYIRYSRATWAPTAESCQT